MSCDRRFEYLQKALASLIALALLSFSNLNAQAAKSRDLIVVIDVSTSMAEVFDKAKAEAKQFVSSAQLGDRISVITFGKSSHLVDRTRVRSTFDIARALSEIDDLQPTELSTNLASGMDYGLSEMQQSYGADPHGERVMMWLSDEKSNPPKDIPNLITFETLKQREMSRMPDKSWFVFQAPIKSESESDVRWFVDWASRRRMRLKSAVATDDLGTFMAPDTEREFTVRFEPDTMAVWGTSFSIVAEMKDRNGGAYTANVQIFPSTVVCSGRPWDQKFRIAFPDRAGEYSCDISFVLPSDKKLEISPPQLTLKACVKQEKQIADGGSDGGDAFSSEMEEAVHERLPTETALGNSFRRQLIKDAREQIKSATPTCVIFGPIVEGGRYLQRISISPTRDIPLDSIGLRTDFELPDGIELKSKYTIKEGKLIADLLLLAWRIPQTSDGWEVKGAISFFSNVEGAEIHPAHVPARIYTKSALPRWGRREFPLSTTYGGVGKIIAVVRRYFVGTLEALVAIIFLRLAYRFAKRHIFSATELVGILEIIKDPTGRKIRYFNLRRIGKQKMRNSVAIGRSKKADIILDRPTIGEIHAEIMTARTDAGVIMFIKPLGNNHVRINDVAYTRQKEINDGDVITIGDCVFRYVRPETYRETILSFADGRSLKGSLVSWDTDSSSFEFLPKGALSRDSRIVVDFSNLKMVSFLRRERRSSFDRFRGFFRNGSGRPVEILFKDGNLFDGFMVGENGERNKRFYFVPKESDDTALILIERSAVQEIFAAEPPRKRFLGIGRMFRASAGRA